MQNLRVGIDLGGTKIEILLLEHGREIFRKRIATPQKSYGDILDALEFLVADCRAIRSGEFSVGIGMPGALSQKGLVKNSNTVCLNGMPFKRDIESRLNQQVTIMNDANCFALSEAWDGAGNDFAVVFGVIIGTGVGGGIAIQRKVLTGCNSIAGEWGHNCLPENAPRITLVDRPCYCGKKNCVETFLSGSGLAKTYAEISYKDISALRIGELIVKKDSKALEAYAIYEEQLAAALSVVVNVLDPDVVVLGGGLSGLPQLAENTQALLPKYVFSDSVNTKVVNNVFGDSSGVRGAAWL